MDFVSSGLQVCQWSGDTRKPTDCIFRCGRSPSADSSGMFISLSSEDLLLTSLPVRSEHVFLFSFTSKRSSSLIGREVESVSRWVRSGLKTPVDAGLSMTVRSVGNWVYWSGLTVHHINGLCWGGGITVGVRRPPGTRSSPALGVVSRNRRTLCAPPLPLNLKTEHQEVELNTLDQVNTSWQCDSWTG